ncbi:hypothetical protein BaRGS_00000532 [Batillaria attramentaria]|uniref:Secreted protein n=1 Tax=Batillaria attramentaria TaxID=370345 RepID=A0ABD0MAW7_9CAEN
MCTKVTKIILPQVRNWLCLCAFKAFLPGTNQHGMLDTQVWMLVVLVPAIRVVHDSPGKRNRHVFCRDNVAALVTQCRWMRAVAIIASCSCKRRVRHHSVSSD